jgi:hypothetical protein
LLKRAIPPEILQSQFLHCRVLSFPNADYYGLAPFCGASRPEPIQPLAILNKKTCKELRQLKDEHQVFFDATATHEECIQANSKWNLDPSSGVMIVVDITLFGTIDAKESVGQILSNIGTFLQAPLFPRPHLRFPYDNPHFLPLRLDAAHDIIEGRRRLKMQAVGPTPSGQTTRMDMSEEVGYILESLGKGSCLKERQVNSRIIKSKPFR